MGVGGPPHPKQGYRSLLTSWLPRGTRGKKKTARVDTFARFSRNIWMDYSGPSLDESSGNVSLAPLPSPPAT